MSRIKIKRFRSSYRNYVSPPDSPPPKYHANLHYIRAAIFKATGKYLTLSQVSKYLVSEKLLTEAQVKAITFDTRYERYYGGSVTPSREEVIKPIDKLIEEEIIVLEEDDS